MPKVPETVQAELSIDHHRVHPLHTKTARKKGAEI
jgi:hypothetical protein